ncbi:hypothetical protein BI49514_02466 [Brevibacterium iodinum ATCC 49514]|uniref:PQQ-like domain-containing protein n=1 Tax=Brevibacterium iodinum ATCC 49514 TaxID=1255616 RepID=A0A2H1JXR0_9MICO|nr:hypothetical protein [Brevibacterium iodinum]SMX92108.1 hypothetical protein BI49514_02466 [Brevibacterium iodinum ATCC 49514]SUW13181.1 Uncharacterised protein [Brevibacterium iodinum]
MARALIAVSDDGFTYTTLNGATSRYSDTGQAISYLGDYARETATPLAVTIGDGEKTTEIGIDVNGKVGAAPSPSSDTGTEAAPTESSSAAPANGAGGSAGHTGDAGHDETATSNGDSYPTGTPFSGPAVPAAPTVKKTPVKKRSASGRPQRLKKITVPGLVLIGLAILMIGAFVVPNIVPVNSDGAPQTIGSEQEVNPASELSVDSTQDVVPSYVNSPTWETKVPKRASVTASDRGVLLVNDNKLEVLDADTGKSRYKAKISESPTFAVDTVIDGRPALLWQSGNTAEALFDGDSKPKTYQLPEKARITSAGKSVLIKSGNRLSTFGADGLENVPTPQAGSTPMAIDDDELFSSDWNGPVKAQNIKTGEERSIKLESPGDELQIIDWISAGHGKAITLWGEQGASTNSGHRIQLVVHSLDDGSILSTVTTTTDIVGEKSWVRGQAGQRAYIGPYLFDLESGLLLMDVSSRDIHLSEPRGTIVPCTMDTNSSCLLAGKQAFKTDTELLAVVDKGHEALVLGEDSTVRAYPKKSETQDR